MDARAIFITIITRRAATGTGSSRAFLAERTMIQFEDLCTHFQKLFGPISGKDGIFSAWPRLVIYPDGDLYLHVESEDRLALGSLEQPDVRRLAALYTSYKANPWITVDDALAAIIIVDAIILPK